jgi:predicted O-methyltransferase YrrM
VEHHHHQHGPAAEPDEAAMAELLDLDAEVLHSYLSEVTACIDALAAEPPHRILDLGSGTGTGALALARRFPGAGIIAATPPWPKP